MSPLVELEHDSKEGVEAEPKRGHALALVDFGKRGILPVINFGPVAHAYGHLQVVGVPDREMQTDYIWGEGPGLASTKQVVSEITGEIAFNFLRAQILFERISPKFKQLRGCIPIDDKLVLIGDHMTSSKRNEIVGQLIGTYPRGSIYFCSTSEADDVELSPVQMSLLNEIVPNGWEIARGSESTWTRSFPQEK